MFRKIFLAATLNLLALICAPNAEAACSSYPNTLTNGTTADATQVMANFNCAALTAGPSFAAPLTVTSTSVSPMVSFIGSGASANLLAQSNLYQASIELDGAVGQASQLYFFSGATAHWASGLTGGGITSYSFYNYPNGLTVFALSETGNATLSGCLTYNGGTLGTCLSDARTKKNIAPFRAGLQQIAALNPVTYQYNGLGETAADGKVRTGLVAQDVQAVAPELVQATNTKLDIADKSGKPLMAVKYGDLTFALINAVKELKATNDNQAAEIVIMKRQLASLRQQFDERQSTR